ncbi:precorrin-3B synthase [Actinophytocola oryzae]|uniref:precorrin-3B synthase n=1 Tax=Actinophytocola oryzae TaxID=502181 RepID=UPI001FB88351|nr:precorrin-3B synthase [Actinophytocola oryzae]
MPAQRPELARQDACPGALRPHPAADGLLVRVRLPGGLTTPAQLAALAGLAREFSDGHLELTSRANVQLRALPADSVDEVARRLAACGLLPSASHERVRNILASPMDGRGPGGRLPVRPVVAELDRRLLDEPTLAALSGRFLFAVDDGGGDVLGFGADLALYPVSGREIALLLAGVDRGLRLAPRDAASVLVEAASAFLAERAAQESPAWRLADLAVGPSRVSERMVGSSLRRVSDVMSVPAGEPEPPVGVLAESGGRYAVGALVPLGRLSGEQAHLLARLGELGRGEVVVTPWRTVLVGGLDEETATAWTRQLGDAGLPASPESPWAGVFACAGEPRCAKALADVRADAAEVVRQSGRGSRPVHWAGCDRQCGKPAGAVEVVATRNGYEVRDGDTRRHCPSARLAATVSTAREARA